MSTPSSLSPGQTVKSFGGVKANPSEKARDVSDPAPAVEGKSATGLAKPQVAPKEMTCTRSSALHHFCQAHIVGPVLD